MFLIRNNAPWITNACCHPESSRHSLQGKIHGIIQDNSGLHKIKLYSVKR
jgi:hypothetical protein